MVSEISERTAGRLSALYAGCGMVLSYAATLGIAQSLSILCVHETMVSTSLSVRATEVA